MEFLKSMHVSKFLLTLNVVLSVVYFYFVVAVFPIGNWPLFTLLVLSEVFHVWQVFGFIHTVWYRRREKLFEPGFQPPVAVFITVCGEPKI